MVDGETTLPFGDPHQVKQVLVKDLDAILIGFCGFIWHTEEMGSMDLNNQVACRLESTNVD